MIRKALQEGNLRGLFIELLGWDYAHGVDTVAVNGRQFTIQRIAHKRGFQVFEHEADRISTQTLRYVKELE